uniref:Purine-uracil permease NCS1 n=1 Tax=Ananas comosus var. bracteatus TaxID=296719 RepID=A0A6V7QRV1_ANACO
MRIRTLTKPWREAKTSSRSPREPHPFLVRHREPMDQHAGLHSVLLHGRQSRRPRHVVVARHHHDRRRKHDNSHPSHTQRAPGDALRHSLPRAPTVGLRSPRSSCPLPTPQSSRLWLVRHRDLDRRSGYLSSPPPLLSQAILVCAAPRLARHIGSRILVLLAVPVHPIGHHLEGHGHDSSYREVLAPVLILVILWLFSWAYIKAGGLGEMLSTPSRLDPTHFWYVFFPSLTACINNWSGLSLNISDFTRFVRSQPDQIFGQLGMPLFQGLYAFTGLAIASSTAVIYGRVISNPVELLSVIGGSALTKVIATLGIALTTVTTNIPANMVAPANALVSLSPSSFSFSRGAFLAGILSIGFQPWRIIQSSENFIYTWLVSYSTIFAPITGILLTDYYIVNNKVLDVNALYSADPDGPYYYLGGYNVAAFVALIVTVVPTVPGFLHKIGILAEVSEVFIAIYDNAWFFGILLASIIYWLLTRGRGKSKVRVDPSMSEPLVS